MSTLRPEELVRKAIAAGYRNPASTSPQSVLNDDTCTLAVANEDLEMGDWVILNALPTGYPRVRMAKEDGDATWVGVVTHSVKAQEWCKVKTTGVAVAKVKSDDPAEPGDFLGLKNGVEYAVTYESGVSCGRFLARFGGDSRYAFVSIGSDAPPLALHHHDDKKNSQVVDSTLGVSSKGVPHPELVFKAPLWHVWRVIDIAFTGDKDPRLMTCLGGATEHGDRIQEGWGWGGVIGSAAHTGFGQLGGNELIGYQGVLGAEYQGSTSVQINRINVRSWAGFNARDRYAPRVPPGGSPSLLPFVAPIRFTWCEHERAPNWVVPALCDCVVGSAVTGEPCDPTIQWWAGTMKKDMTRRPDNHTGWPFQWTPQIPVERDCCYVVYNPQTTTDPDPNCHLIDPSTRANIERNAHDVSGGYEAIVPWNYAGCSGRLEMLHAVCYHSVHIQYLWRSLLRLNDALEFALYCLDNRISLIDAFLANKVNGSGDPANTAKCCPLGTGWSVPRVTGGPSSKGLCAQTNCDK